MPEKHIDIEQLITDKLSGAILPDDDKVLADLLANDATVRAMLEEAAAALERYKAVSFGKDIPVHQRFDELMERMGLPESPKVKKLDIKRWRTAAAVLLPVLIGLGWLLLQRSDNAIVMAGSEISDSIFLTVGNKQQIVLTDDHPIQIGALQFSATQGNRDSLHQTPVAAERFAIHVPKGKTYKMVLPDGTHVHLNADSKLEFPDAFLGNSREVELSGEAFFEVSKDPRKPFIVHSKSLHIRVLGTSFNLKSYDNEPFQASVVTGKVLAQSARSSEGIELLPGSAAVKHPNGLLTKVAFAADEVLSWRHGIHYFNNERLDSILTAVNRLSGYEITIASPRLAEIRFSGAYEKSKPIDVLLANITASSSLNYRIEAHRVILY